MFEEAKNGWYIYRGNLW